MGHYLFLVIEGTDGVGKSTLAKTIVERLSKRGIKTVMIAFGMEAIDKAINELKNSSKYDMKAHFFLAMANSIVTYNESIGSIKNNLESNESTVFIFDRYFYTTVAYNVALGLDYTWCREVAEVIPQPHKVIYCDLPVEEAAQRKKLYEKIETGFSTGKDVKASFYKYQSAVKDVYERIIAEDPNIFLRVNTEHLDSAANTVISFIDSYFNAAAGNKEGNNDILRLANYLNSIPISEKSEEIGTYKSAVLICLDAVLSINRKYYKFVVPRIKHFMENYPEITTLKELHEILTQEEGFGNYWNYNHKSREDTLKELVLKFLEIEQDYPANSEMEALRQWSQSVNVLDYKKFGVHGIGIATFQYLRLLLGASTVKPDVHIKRAVTEALNRKVGDIEMIFLFEKACEYIHVPTKIMDHSLWLKMAQNVNEEYEWTEGRWNRQTSGNL